MQKGEQEEDMRVMERVGNMLVDGNAVMQRWAEYFEEMLNVENDAQASIVVVVGDKMVHVFGRLNIGGVESYEEE